MFVLSFLVFTANAQQPIPSDAAGFYLKAMSQINQKHIVWVKSTAGEVNKEKIDEAGIRNQAERYGRGLNLSKMDIDALISLIMIQAAKDQEQDMRKTMEEMKKNNEEKKIFRQAIDVMKKNKSPLSRNMADSFRTMASVYQTNTVNNKIVISNTESTKPINKNVNSPLSTAETKEIQDALKRKLDNMNEMNEMTSMKLQMVRDRRNIGRRDLG